MIQRLFVIIGLMAALLPATAQAGVQDFSISSFVADYYLSRDGNGSSHLTVEERIIAEFPNFDQNHGILRAIPKKFEGHSLNLKLTSVTNAQGNSLAYSTSTQNDNLVLKIGEADKYVRGRQAYHITYELTSVMAKSAGYNGLFWNVNGTQWSQVFGNVTARVHLDDELFATLASGQAHCYTGPSGSTKQDCTLAGSSQNGQTTLTFTTTKRLQAGETLTYNLRFNDGTFAAYHRPLSELLMLLLLVFGLGILPPVLAAILAGRRWWKYGRDPEGRGVIIAEYLQPKDLSVLEASALLKQGFQTKAVSATLLDLAVRHYLRIYELKQKKLFKDKIDYELEIIRLDDSLRKDELQVLAMVFDSQTRVGSKVKLSSLSAKLYTKAGKIGKAVNQKLSTDGYFRTNPERAGLPMLIMGIILGLLGFVVLPYSLGLLLAGLICVGFSFVMPARTARGVEVRDYLLGLKHYMKLAEADRLKTLQSPQGKLTEKIDVTDQAQLVKLYEKLLPYAMLFGIEQDWAKQFAHLYQQPPDWYAGSAGFNAAYFAGSLHGFGAASTTSFSPPASSGSGGSAGGGGGGGGGGGW